MTKERLIELWEEHIADEFAIKDAQATIDTMCEDAYVNHVPTLAGGYGHEELLAFYSQDFIPVMPPDMQIINVSRTVGENQLVDEMVLSFTHSCSIPWMLPGVAPTYRKVQIPLVAIVGFRDDKLVHEHIYWDQASVLKQIGLLNDPALPVFGAETAEKVLDPTLRIEAAPQAKEELV
jgi:carboxymethylenebutenolidase